MSTNNTRQTGTQKNGEWTSWALIIFLFAIGVWPVALFLLFFKLFGNDSKHSKQSQIPPLQSNPLISSRPDVGQNAGTAQTGAQQSGQYNYNYVYEQAGSTAKQAVRQAKYAAKQAAREAKYAMRQERDSVRQDRRADAAARRMTKSPELKSSNARMLKIIGLILAIGGAYMAFDPIDMMVFLQEVESYYLWDALKYAAIAVGGVAMFFSGISMDRTMKRYARYLAVIGNLEALSLEQLSRKLGYSEKKVAKDLQKMIEKGYFGGEAYLNMELGYFFRSGQADADYEQRRRTTTEAQTPKEAEEGYSGILRNIRRANDRIADPVLSQKIDRLEEITAKIFRAVEEDPKKRSRIDTFLNYYLPTTQKLLDSYAEFEATGIEGENLRQAKERIQKTMDSIIGGFEHQLDELYKADAMDVDSDIRVMESMLNRDTSTVEKDFGMGVTPASDADLRAAEASVNSMLNEQPAAAVSYTPTLTLEPTPAAQQTPVELGVGTAPAAPKIEDLDLGGMAAQRQQD
jgi:AraC-like DNA-binding protein